MAITEVNLSLEEGRRCQIFTRSEILAADDPEHPEEEAEGPDPLELLLAALAGSAAMAMRDAAERLGLEPEEVQVKVTWRRGHHAELAAMGEVADAGTAGGTTPAPGAPRAAVTPRPPIQRESRVRLARDINEAERDALLRAAKTSPVDQALAGGTPVEDALFIFGYATGE